MNWKRGITLMTPTTKRWSKEQIEKNDSIDERIIQFVDGYIIWKLLEEYMVV